jgi:DNA-binding HxlR family transcriptional regulator
MATQRSYNDRCGIAHALDLVGERWALLVVRELVLGPKRYTDLLAALPDVSTNVLSRRIDELKHAGVVRRRRLPPPAASSVYELTEWGQQLEPIIIQLGRWGARSPSPPQGAHLSATSFILSLQTYFDPHAGAGITASYELRLGEDTFHATVDHGQFEVVRGSANQPDATFEADPVTLLELIHGGRDFAKAVRGGALTVQGDKSAAETFLTLFSTPEPTPKS